MKIEKYGITLRPVELSDAEFIVGLRTDEKLGRFLSPTLPDIDAQREWLKKYKEREANGTEFYFIAEHQGRAYGTTRIYNITENCFEVGSWLFAKDSPRGVSILADIAGREFAFEKLTTPICKFEVRRDNLTVIKYHKGYCPTLVDADELNYYFTLDRASFTTHATKLIKILSK